MAKARKSKAEIAYNKELRRLNNFIRRAESRGFRFDKSSIIPPRPQKPTAASVRRLQALTANKLYQKATYLTDDGKVVSGYKGRTLERKRAGKKAYKTQQKRRHESEVKKQREKLIEAGVFDIPRSEDVLLNNIDKLLTDYPTLGAVYLKKMLNYQIKRFGRKRVAMALSRSPEDVVKVAQDIVYYESDSSSTSRAIRSMAELITGTILTDEELRDLGSIQESTDFTDFL